jgi:hypothetical protein
MVTIINIFGSGPSHPINLKWFQRRQSAVQIIKWKGVRLEADGPIRNLENGQLRKNNFDLIFGA